jgi:hypothetical protein
MIRALMLAALLTGVFAADAPSQPLPPDVLKIVEKHDAALATAKRAFDSAAAKADTEGSAALDKAVKDATKRGDLQAALAIQELQKKWTQSNGDLLGDKGKTAGLLYVCCGSNVEVFLKGKSIGKSSQWGDLIPIEVKLADGDDVIFQCSGEAKHTYGVSWLFFTTDKAQYVGSSLKNTLGKMTGELNRDGVAVGQAGAAWVNGSLVNRLPDDLKKSVPPEAIEMKKKTQTEPDPTQSIYVWIFKSDDLKKRR